jgi:hypothetical protein
MDSVDTHCARIYMIALVMVKEKKSSQLRIETLETEINKLETNVKHSSASPGVPTKRPSVTGTILCANTDIALQN